MRHKQGDCLLLTGAEVQRAKMRISTVFTAVVLLVVELPRGLLLQQGATVMIYA